MENIYRKLEKYEIEKYKFIADFLLNYDNPDELTSKIVQEECHVSPATITKFVHSLGFTHFIELRCTMSLMKNIFTSMSNNLLLPQLVCDDVIEETLELYYTILQSDYVIVTSDLNNKNLANELSRSFISLKNTYSLYADTPSVMNSQLKYINTNNKVAILFIGNLDSEIVELIPYYGDLDVNIINIGTIEEQVFMPRKPYISYITLEPVKVSNLDSHKILYLYLGYIAHIFTCEDINPEKVLNNFQ